MAVLATAALLPAAGRPRGPRARQADYWWATVAGHWTARQLLAHFVRRLLARSVRRLLA